MFDFLQTLKAEYYKLRHSNFLKSSFVAFALAPIIGGVFILLVQDPEALAKAGGLALKVKAMNFAANWNSYFIILTQAIGVGGILIFGFVISWLFGREYSDGTAKDLLALPTSRTQILNAKFMLYAAWCLALVLCNLIIALIIGTLLQLESLPFNSILPLLKDYFLTTLFAVLIGFPIAFFALRGKGYLSPLAFVALTLVFAQVIAATGYGNYFPWSIPGLFSSAGAEYKAQLNYGSYSTLFATGLIGYFLTVVYWKHADQTK